MRNSGVDQVQPEEKLLGQYIPLHYHFNMLQDESRVESFRKAINAYVRPGMKVLELGGGTGILSSFAARQGAEVFCVERNPALVAKARELLERNGLGGLVSVIHADAMDYVPPSSVDVVICEMLHVGMLREKQLNVIEAFKARYAKAGFSQWPVFIPNSSMLAVQPLEFDFVFAGYEAPIPLFQAPTDSASRSIQLADLHPYATIHYEDEFPKRFRWSGDLTISHPGRFCALRFMTQNLLAYRPNEVDPVTWPNQLLVLPVAEPVAVEPGQVVRVSFDYESGQPLESLAESLSIAVEHVERRRAA